MIKVIMILLVLFLVACALGAGFTKNLLVFFFSQFSS